LDARLSFECLLFVIEIRSRQIIAWQATHWRRAAKNDLLSFWASSRRNTRTPENISTTEWEARDHGARRASANLPASFLWHQEKRHVSTTLLEGVTLTMSPKAGSRGVHGFDFAPPLTEAMAEACSRKLVYWPPEFRVDRAAEPDWAPNQKANSRCVPSPNNRSIH